MTPASGTRLHARLVTGGGAREVVGFHDSKRDEDCTFQPADDGRMRCLPPNVLQPATIAFADAACTIPLVQVPVQQPPGCADVPKYAMTLDAVGCSSPKELRKLVPSSGSARYFNSGSGCTVQQAPPSSPPLFTLGDTVSLLELVEAKVTPGAPLGNGVSETVLVGNRRVATALRLPQRRARRGLQLRDHGRRRHAPSANGAAAAPIFTPAM